MREAQPLPADGTTTGCGPSPWRTLLKPGSKSRFAFLSLLGMLAACHESSERSSLLPPGVTALGFAADSVALSDGVLAAPEFEAGEDRNGDGDGDDTVLHVLDLLSGRSTLVPDVELVSLGGGDGFVAFTVSEGAVGRDLNGD